ncbi:quinolinate synthase NadA [bacterium]|nr:quinolinate synthase NadA [bacterium]
MKNSQIVAEINRLKKEHDAVILAHNYQIPEVQEIADFLGDSLDLSKKAAKDSHSTIIFCGVKFMAETAKILSPQKKVFIPRLEAGCPMADMADTDSIREMKEKHPLAKVVTYVNSTAEVKALSDVCCTSANSINVVNNIDADEIIFAPDKNLGAYTQRFSDKKIILWDGFCYVHTQFTPDEVENAKKKYPEAVVMVHPECSPEVIDKSDKVFSTSGMIKFAEESENKIFIVGTEEGLIHRLQRENPDKTFLSLGSAKACSGMKSIRLIDVYNSLREGQYVVEVDSDIMDKARTALEKMIDYV